MRAIGRFAKGWWSASLIVILAATLTVSAVPQPVPVTISFSKAIVTQVGTLSVSGFVMIDAATQSANGTLHIVVTNSTGGIITDVSLSFWNNGTVVGPFTQSVSLPSAALVAHVTVDPPSGPLLVTYDVLVGSARRP